MNLKKILKNGFLVLVASLVLTACATQKSAKGPSGQMQGDTYIGDACTDTLDVKAETTFKCKTSIENCNDFWYGGINWPCPTGSCNTILMWDTANLNWVETKWKQVGICENGVVTNYEFLIKGC